MNFKDCPQSSFSQIFLSLLLAGLDVLNFKERPQSSSLVFEVATADKFF